MIEHIICKRGAGPGFLERGFICIKGWGSFCWFHLIFLSHGNEIIWSRPTYFNETKLFHFHRVFKKRGGGQGLWVRAKPTGSATVNLDLPNQNTCSFIPRLYCLYSHRLSVLYTKSGNAHAYHGKNESITIIDMLPYQVNSPGGTCCNLWTWIKLFLESVTGFL